MFGELGHIDFDRRRCEPLREQLGFACGARRSTTPLPENNYLADDPDYDDDDNDDDEIAYRYYRCRRQFVVESHLVELKPNQSYM
jgi:hypothetical protein